MNERKRGPLDAEFERGYVPMDEPPGIEEREYRQWKEAGGQVNKVLIRSAGNVLEVKETPPEPMPFIVAEITKNRIAGQPLTPGLIQRDFERIINLNEARGYRLHSFTLHQLITGPDSMTETIIAVFEERRWTVKP